MRINFIKIHNFRSIIDAGFRTDDYLLIVGANNAGKSSIIDAIRCFYESDKDAKYVEARDFPKIGAKDQEAWIEVTYELTTDEYVSLKKEYQSADRLLTLHKVLLGPKEKTGFIFFRSQDGILSETPFYGAKNVQDGKIGSIVYVPALSRVDDQAKLTGPSALRELLTKILEGVLQESVPYREFSEQIDQFAHKVGEIETEDHLSLSGFQQKLNESLCTWGTRFSLKMLTPSPAEMVKNMLSWTLLDNNLQTYQAAERYGSGFQRHFIYSLIKLSAELVPKKRKQKAKDFSPALTLLLFEEPEAFLHPQQQDELSRSLKTISEEAAWQVFCTTHSPHFVSHSMEDLKSIVRIQKESAISRAFQIDGQLLQQIFNPVYDSEKYPVLAEKHNGDTTLENEGIKFSIWLNPVRAGMFFASHVLLSEGPTEVALLSRLQDDRLVKLPQGAFAMDCFGKFNIFRFMKLLGALGIRHSVLHDKDSSKEQAEWNQLTLDSKNEFTDKVIVVDPDVEGELGVDKPKCTHAKPQCLLSHYVKGDIERGRLENFARKLESAFDV